jgi:hypothetical protein
MPRATSSLRDIPPDQVFTNRSAASVRPKRASSRSARAAASPPEQPWIRAASTRFSRPVAIGSVEGFCDTRPMARRTASEWRSTSMPATAARPESGRDRVVSTRTVVDLPAPLRPSRAKTLPGATAKVRPSRARTGAAPRPGR